MEQILQGLALCRGGLAQFGSQPMGLAVALFLAGLGGSAVHCAGMCGPFVLGQVMADAQDGSIRTYGEWHRLAGASLLPYHLGRLTTYAGLGMLAGGATALFAASPAFAWISAILLAIGGAFMLVQAFGLAASVPSPLGSLLTRLAAPLSASHGAPARYALGCLLGFLPCGLIYGALGAAAGTGSPAQGAYLMAAFAVGTMPALIAVGWGGILLRRRFRQAGRWIFLPLLVANAGLMLALAGERLASTGTP